MSIVSNNIDLNILIITVVLNNILKILLNSLTPKYSKKGPYMNNYL